MWEALCDMSPREEKIFELLRNVRNPASEAEVMESLLYGNLKMEMPELQRATVAEVVRQALRAAR